MIRLNEAPGSPQHQYRLEIEKTGEPEVDERRAKTVMLEHELANIREQLVAIQKESQRLRDGQ